MKVLVTGGSGFIASHTILKLIELGITPIVMDYHKRTSYPDGVELILGDVRGAVVVNEAVAKSDGVLHIAGVLGTSETIANPIPAVETNILGGINIFQACKAYDKRCVYITVGNYWMNNSYSITKTTSERFAWMFNKEFDTKIAVVRALNAYGPGQKEKPVRKIMPNFIIPALLDKEITVYGDGKQIMDMIFVEDVADILIRALLLDHNQYKFDPTQNEDNKVRFEAGTGRNTTVQEIAQMVIDIVGKGTIKNIPMRQGEPEGSIVVGNPDTLASLYDEKTPELTSLEDGLIPTIEYYKRYLKL